MQLIYKAEILFIKCKMTVFVACSLLCNVRPAAAASLVLFKDYNNQSAA